ncbi:TadE/TadG family type IV pilus assembly protein [Shinella zoogloeoides]|uniref:TadE/TadG family type IV pilus assembly protein n=1 Tax=Shinella zoogloeoides TaxID=352475 RepID=UPI000E65CC85|nr:pilus assembly protein TadG-related protein [Shinella zoogloeoides]
MRWFSAFARSKSGNFGMLAALVSVPFFGAAGAAIDFSQAVFIRSQLFDAADAAALAAITEKSQGVAEAVKMGADGEVKIAAEDGRLFFLAQRPNALTDVTLSVDMSVFKKGSNLNSRVDFTAEIPTTFMRILGKNSITVSGTATATYQTDSFIDFFMLLDNTPSMGVGATPADVTKLVNATSDKCAFACHIVNNGVSDKNSYYNLARKIGATIRIDVVAKATAALMDEAVSTQKYSGQFRIAAYTFGEAATDVKLYTVSKLTADLSAIKKAAENIKLMSIPYQGYDNDQQTSFDDALTKINAEIDQPGDGTTMTNREKIVFFVADGVGDSNKPKGCTKKLTGNRCQEPIDVKYCKALKDRGIRVAVLYTTYLPLPTNDWYNSWIKPFQSEIGGKMKECASDDLYFEVSPTEGIEAAMKALFIKAVKSPRVTS